MRNLFAVTFMLLLGTAISFGAALLVGIWFPKLAVWVFLSMCGWCCYLTWKAVKVLAETSVVGSGALTRADKRPTKRILVVDDDEAIRGVISEMLASGGYECRAVAGGLDALALLESGEEFHLLVTDLLNSPLDGMALLRRTKDRFPGMPVVVASALDDEDLIQSCIRAGAYEYLVEPFEREQLLVTVSRALEHRSLTRC